jgi:choline dehydrogenase-like flavoprotein
VKTAIVVGSGAGGATVAKELQGKYEVTVLEAGSTFRPFVGNLALFGRLKQTGLLFDERMIRLIFPVMQIRRAADKMILVNGIGHGGTTTICAGNAVRKDEDLQAIGINLDIEFQELYQEIPVYTEHQSKWHDRTKQAFDICRDLNLKPMPTPKMADAQRCSGCGKCVLGCPRDAKWDARRFLQKAMEKGVVENGQATGVEATSAGRTRFYPADLTILAAGGLGTPVILQNSGIECTANLFVDPVLCVAARIPNSQQDREIPMPFIVQGDNFILSPYFDFLSFFFNKHWKCPPSGIYSLMIKLADSNCGSISRRGVRKSLTDQNQATLKEGVALCTEIFRRLGIGSNALFRGTLNAGHPGGMLPLTEKEALTFHSARLPPNLYVSDATLLPRSLGNPPIFTIAAMAKRIGKLCIQKV